MRSTLFSMSFLFVMGLGALAQATQTYTYYMDADADGLGDPEESFTCNTTDDPWCPQGDEPTDIAQADGGYVSYVLNADDLEPDCVSNDTDVCGVCAGQGPVVYYSDFDEDGLGDPNDATPPACFLSEVFYMTYPSGFSLAYVPNADDDDPYCLPGGRDECGICGGDNSYCAGCDGIPNSGLELDACGVCGGEGVPEGACDCAGNIEDSCGVCGGPGPLTYYSDYDQDGLGYGASTTLTRCPLSEPSYEYGVVYYMLGETLVAIYPSPMSMTLHWVLNADDPEATCASNDTDVCGVCAGEGIAEGACDCFGNVEDMCGVCGGNNSCLGCDGVAHSGALVDACGTCGGSGPLIFYPDLDQDGLGDPGASSQLCPEDMDFLEESSVSWVTNSDDVDPLCATNDSDQCGLCGGIDMCGVCGGDGSTCVTQTIDLEEGWNMISFNVLPLEYHAECGFSCGRLIEDLLAGYEDKVSIVKDGQGNAWIPGSFNMMGEVAFGEGYQIKVFEAFTFTVEGGVGAGANTALSLFDGWDILGTTLSEPIAPECLHEYIQEYYPDNAGLLTIKNNNGAVYLPEWSFNGIGELMPGVGYQIKIDVDGGIYFDWASVRDGCSFVSARSLPSPSQEPPAMVGMPSSSEGELLDSPEDDSDTEGEEPIVEEQEDEDLAPKLKERDARQSKGEKRALKGKKKKKKSKNTSRSLN